MKITIIGASGAVGLQTTQAFLYKIVPNISELNLIVNSENGMIRVHSLVRDALVNLRSIKINVSKTCENLEKTDIIIFCAGQAVSQELSQIKQSNRDQLYEKNLEIVMKYVDEINRNCEDALFILVTNPVAKIMSNLYGKLNAKLVGVGVTNDTLRFRNALYQNFQHTNNIEESISKAFIIGDHSSYDRLTYVESLLDENILKELTKERNLFNKKFQRQRDINEIKKYQEQELKKVFSGKKSICDMFENLNQLPTFMSSYFTHRSIHFTMKTSFSTSLAILELVHMFCNHSEKYMSAEVVCNNYSSSEKSILGIPITFRNGIIEPMQIKYSTHEKQLLKTCFFNCKINNA